MRRLQCGIVCVSGWRGNDSGIFEECGEKKHRKTIDEAKNGHDAFRISFAKVDPETAEEGIKRLAEAFREYGK